MIAVVLLGCVTFGTAELVHTEHVRAYSGLSPICRVATTDRIVALTFDDGPDPQLTPLVLRMLRESRAQATFFLIGEQAVAYPALVRQEIDSGMQIGDHTWSHPALTGISVTEARSQVSRTLVALESAGAGAVNTFRAPYGTISPQQLAMVRSLGLTPVHWTVALDHYVGGMGLQPPAAARQLAADVRPGDIILAHDAHDGGINRVPAMQALALLLPMLRERGYRFVSIDELLADGAPVRASPRPWFWETGFNCPSA